MDQFTFSFAGLSAEHVNIILAGLNELPRKVSGELFDAIARSAAAQQAEFEQQLEANAPVSDVEYTEVAMDQEQQE